ncbi:MAG: HAD family hydrolase [Eubacteriales bacterium]|nr:HAD family hydrolase [Eubacteriales bacterium]
MKYKLVIFDLDGTLLNTLEDLKDSVNYALKNNDMDTRSLDEVREFVGNGIRKLIERCVPENTGTELTDKTFDDFCRYYKEHSMDKTIPYPGIIDSLKKLHNNSCFTAVISNKADFAVQNLCNHFFGENLDYVAGAREGINKKPSPDAVYDCISHFGLEKCDVVYVGDSEVDVETCKNAGIDGIFVTWGFRSIEILRNAGAINMVSDCNEMMELLLK